MIEANEHIEVVKLKATNNPCYPTPEFDDYELGVHNNNTSLPVEYKLTGKLVFNIQIGKSVMISRETRNGVVKPGTMTTSAVVDVKEIDENTVEISTRNSVYRMTRQEKLVVGETKWNLN